MHPGVAVARRSTSCTGIQTATAGLLAQLRELEAQLSEREYDALLDIVGAFIAVRRANQLGPLQEAA